MAHLFSDQNFLKEVLEAKEVVLVDFFAPWCGPCRGMAPIIDELAKEYEGKGIKIGKLNIDESPLITSQFNIFSVPTFIIFKNGKEAERIVGAASKKELEEKLSKITK